MTNSQRLATVRACLLRWLAGQQGDAADPQGATAITREAILIRDDFYCGRRFHASGFQAVWFIEEDELKIYRTDGQLVCSFAGQQIDERADRPPRHDQTPAGQPDVISLAPPPAHQPGEQAIDPRRDVRRAA